MTRTRKWLIGALVLSTCAHLFVRFSFGLTRMQSEWRTNCEAWKPVNEKYEVKDALLVQVDAEAPLQHAVQEQLIKNLSSTGLWKRVEPVATGADASQALRVKVLVSNKWWTPVYAKAGFESDVRYGSWADAGGVSPFGMKIHVNGATSWKGPHSYGHYKDTLTNELAKRLSDDFSTEWKKTVSQG